MPGTVYLVATPIGNLSDITFRAIETLRQVDVIACEDTRHTRKLLNAHEITNKLVSFHEHNEAVRTAEFAEMLIAGKSIAVVSDAGTPGINDPGYLLVRRAHEIGSAVVPIPGAVAFVNAAIVSGLPTDSIFFGGFLPSKGGERRKRLESIKDVPATLVFYETPHRIAKALADCLAVLGDRPAAVVRELTKLHEIVLTSNLSALATRFAEGVVKGEFVLVIGRAENKTGTSLTSDVGSLAAKVAEHEGSGLDRKAALKKAAKDLGLTRSEAYRLMQSERAKS